MMKSRPLAAALVGGAMLVAAAAVSAADAPPGSAAPGECLGLACFDSEQDVPEARGPVPSVSGPSQLAKQTEAGFYEYGLNTSYRKRAVAYVVPPGQSDRMPASVRNLPMVTPIETSTDLFHDGHTVVILSREVGSAEPRTEMTATAARSRHARSPRARAASEADCATYWFCVWDFQNTTGTMKFLYGNGTGWLSLDACCNFSDRAESAANHRNNDSLLNRNNPATNGPNDRYCSNSHSVDFDLDNNFGGNGRNVASSWANTPDDIHC